MFCALRDNINNERIPENYFKLFLELDGNAKDDKNVFNTGFSSCSVHPTNPNAIK